MEEKDFQNERPLKLFYDNKSVVLYFNNNRSLTKSKYIDIKFLLVKERVQSEHISIEHIDTNSMVADPLTKGLPPKVFHEHTTRMGIMSLEDIQFQWEFVILDASMIQTYFQLFQFMDILRLFSAEIKFWFIHTLILVWFNLTKV